MIAPQERPLASAVVRALLRRRARARLSRFAVVGREHLVQAAAQGPVVLVANHVSFWDGIVAGLATLGIAEARFLMHADQVRKAPVLRWVGAIGMEQGKHDRALAVRAALRHLSGPRRALWIFPQGELRPQWELPLRFAPGAAFIAGRAGAQLLPAALQYEMGECEQPASYLAIGAPCADAARGVEEQLASLRALIAARAPLPALWGGRPRLGEGVLSRVLARLVRA